MVEQQRKRDRGVELLPWQAAVMVMAVTVAGLLHEHPGRVRPLVERVHASAHAAGGAELLEVVVRLSR